MSNPNDPGPAEVAQQFEGPGIDPNKVDEIMNFDPFGPPEGKEGEQAPKEQEKPAELTGEAGAAPKVVDPSAPKEPAKPEPAPSAPDAVAALQQQIERQQQQIAALLAKVSAPETKPTEAAKPEEAPKPAYNFQAPAALMQALSAEDEGTRTQAMSLLINSVMNRIHLDVSKMLEDKFGSLTKELPAQVQRVTQETTQVQRIEQDILGAYPVLAGNEQLRGLFYNTMAGIARARTAAGLDVTYSQELRDAAAQQLAATLSIPITNLQGQAQGAPSSGTPTTARAPARAPFAGGSSAARGGNGKDNTAFGADLLSDL